MLSAVSHLIQQRCKTSLFMSVFYKTKIRIGLFIKNKIKMREISNNTPISHTSYLKAKADFINYSRIRCLSFRIHSRSHSYFPIVHVPQVYCCLCLQKTQSSEAAQKCPSENQGCQRIHKD